MKLITGKFCPVVGSTSFVQKTFDRKTFGAQNVGGNCNIEFWKFKIQILMEQWTLKIVNTCLKTNIYSYLEMSGCKSCNLYFNVVHFLNTSIN